LVTIWCDSLKPESFHAWEFSRRGTWGDRKESDTQKRGLSPTRNSKHTRLRIGPFRILERAADSRKENSAKKKESCPGEAPFETPAKGGNFISFETQESRENYSLQVAGKQGSIGRWNRGTKERNLKKENLCTSVLL